jgi:hypothetical protein
MVTCNKCNDGYFLYPNTYLFQVFDDDKEFIDGTSDPLTVYPDFLSYNLMSQGSLYMNPNMRQCKKTEVRHLLTFSTKKT